MDDYERKVYELLDFYKQNKTKIKFRNDNNVEIAGTVDKINTLSFFGRSPHAIVELSGGSLMKIYLRDIDYTKILPAEVETVPAMLRLIRTSISPRKKMEIFRRDGLKCSYCGEQFPVSQLEVDHVIPVSKGGSDDDENLTTACINCNRVKGDK